MHVTEALDVSRFVQLERLDLDVALMTERDIHRLMSLPKLKSLTLDVGRWERQFQYHLDRFSLAKGAMDGQLELPTRIRELSFGYWAPISYFYQFAQRVMKRTPNLQTLHCPAHAITWEHSDRLATDLWSSLYGNLPRAKKITSWFSPLHDYMDMLSLVKHSLKTVVLVPSAFEVPMHDGSSVELRDFPLLENISVAGYHLFHPELKCWDRMFPWNALSPRVKTFHVKFMGEKGYGIFWGMGDLKRGQRSSTPAANFERRVKKSYKDPSTAWLSEMADKKHELAPHLAAVVLEESDVEPYKQVVWEGPQTLQTKFSEAGISISITVRVPFWFVPSSIGANGIYSS
ncbi:MAG: hypothetical protein M1828_006001 [Chrysothrix sp. TS-e1954]|nr:MAG: hypothetical protein M1828_006001 [Chrysothrix sp. TS-e1954]